MNTNENQLLNSLLVLAALANVSPEKLKEYANALSLKNRSTNVRSDDRFSDADILRSAAGLLRVYRDETIAKMVPAERHPFLRKITPAIGVLEDCLEYYTNKQQAKHEQNKRARRAFELLREAQDIEHELQDMKLALATCKHTDK